MKQLKTVTVMLFLSYISLSAVAPDQGPVRTISAVRIAAPPKIDGVLEESIWQTLPVLDNFWGYYPHNDRPGSRPVKAHVGYDDNALYIGALLYDNPDSITQSLGKRDSGDGVNTDLFAIYLSPYNDR
ncbi:MAG TPA: hypothetical protein ENN20_08195, partial [Candidatus Marinimicrobia bacterium]|nr:hypothetical protein [Candidatus Neomarinimicrobiota bacterium]